MFLALGRYLRRSPVALDQTGLNLNLRFHCSVRDPLVVNLKSPNLGLSRPEGIFCNGMECDDSWDRETCCGQRAECRSMVFPDG